jgi:hypothetical protein
MKKVLAVLVTVLLVLTPILLMSVTPYAISLIAVPALIMPLVLCEVFSK